jgi:HAE1 family hydrophobic/amphiphilic exporter-1
MDAQTYSQDFKLSGKPAAGIAILPPRCQFAKGRSGRCGEMEELSRRFPAGLHYSIPTIPRSLSGFDQRGLQDLIGERGVLVLIVILDLPAELSPPWCRQQQSGHDHRCFRRHGALGYTVRLSTLFALILAIGIVVDDAIVIVEGVSNISSRGCPDTTPRSRQWTSFRADHRHHLVLMAVFYTVGLCTRSKRPDVCAICLGHRRDGASQRGQRRNAKADAMRAVAAYTGAAGQRNFFYRGFNRVYQSGGKRLSGVDRPDGAPERADGAYRAGAVVRASGASPVCRPPLSRTKTRVICWSRRCCRTGLRSGARPRHSTRRPDRLDTPGVDRVIAISGLSALDNSPTSPAPASALYAQAMGSAQ